MMSDPDGLFMDSGSIAKGVPDDVTMDSASLGASQGSAAPVAAATVGAQAQAQAQAPLGGQAQEQAPAPMPVVQQELPEIAKTINSSAYDTIDVGETMEYTFFNALPEAKQKQFLNNAARTILKEFIKDNTQIVAFGSSALDGVNAITDKILQYNSQAEIPEVDLILEDANRQLDDFAEKGREYREEAKKKQNKFIQWVKGTKRAADDFRFTQKNLVDRFDILAEKIIGQSNKVADGYYHMKELKEKNRESILSIAGVLAMFEAVHIVTLREIQMLSDKITKIEPNTPEYSKQQERLQALAMVANTIQKQHANYMARWLIAQATTEQVTSSMRLSMEIVTKLKMTVTTTIPTMKLIVAQIAQLNTMAEAGKSIDAMQNSFDRTLKMYGKTIETTIPELERSVQKTPITEEQVQELAEKIKKSNEDVVTAIIDGRKNRLNMERAILKASDDIRHSSEEMNRRLVSSLVGNGSGDDGVDGDDINTAMDRMADWSSREAFEVFK